MKAKRLLEAYNLDYVEILIDSTEKKGELFSLVPWAKTVPIIIVDEIVIGGYEALEDAIPTLTKGDT